MSGALLAMSDSLYPTMLRQNRQSCPNLRPSTEIWRLAPYLQGQNSAAIIETAIPLLHLVW
jgi:hypothetical protein